MDRKECVMGKYKPTKVLRNLLSNILKNVETRKGSLTTNILSAEGKFCFSEEVNEDDYKKLVEQADILLKNDLLKLPFKKVFLSMRMNTESREGNFARTDGSFLLCFALTQAEDCIYCGAVFSTLLGINFLPVETEQGNPIKFGFAFEGRDITYCRILTSEYINKPKGSKVVQLDSDQISFYAEIAAAYLVLLHTGGYQAKKNKTKMGNPNKMKRRAKPEDDFYVVTKRPFKKQKSTTSSGNNQHTERLRPRLHMRSGHKRTQHYGPGNVKTKEVFIHPCLVGHEEEGTIFHEFYDIRTKDDE
jgi:hypothetical protein